MNIPLPNETLDETIARLKPRRERAKGRSPLMRRNVIRRADGKCEVCRFAVLDVLNVHHIVPVAKGGESDITNLILLCPNCHALVHFCSRVVDYPDQLLTEDFIACGLSPDIIPALLKVGKETAMVNFGGEIVVRPDAPKGEQPQLSNAQIARFREIVALHT